MNIMDIAFLPGDRSTSISPHPTPVVLKPVDIALVKKQVCDEVDRLASDLIEMSHKIHANPELCFEEHFAHDLLTTVIADHGITVERGAYGLDTAFEANVGDAPGPHVTVVCEYDALPGIGHACGHNIIATAGLGAGLAAAKVAAEVGKRITLVGTPAEEGGGGKEIMLQRGAFTGTDAAMMIHPSNYELDVVKAIAIYQLRAEYQGHPAHAACDPDQGRNALDAAVLGYNAVAALRQHISDDERIHGIFTEAGDKPNIVPANATAEWFVRSPDLEALEVLKERVERCLKAGADAAGCTVKLTSPNPIYADMIQNATLLSSYLKNLDSVGRTISTDPSASSMLSTDMGNVSHKVPSIHPLMKIAPSEVAIHTPEFAEYSASPTGDAAVLDGAKVMAMTVVDCWLDGFTLHQAKTEFEASQTK